ncbi:HD-GYP domain-containing protein, partial [Cellulomonas cellasea]
MAAGPTQNYDDATLGSWRPHPALAAVVRAAVGLAPLLIALATGLAAYRWLPPARVGLHPWVWLALQVTCSTAVLLLAAWAVRRFLPLDVLLRLSLFLPDRAASRFAVARRRHSPAVLHARLEEGRPLLGTDDEAAHGAELLALVARLRAHDRGTFSHSERVQALAALIGTELGLSRVEAAQLGWAAFLHDIGKLEVPREILTKPGRPTDDEWRVVACHPEHGEALAAPLSPWLGPWVDAVGQHHERWDGAGYPHGLAGEQISLGARIIAVADAFDVITSARSYKKPLSASAARTELARCAGSQFDPEVVRAFLAVGLGRLRAVAGPASLVAAVPGLRSMPWPDLAGAASRLTVAGPAA